MNAICKVYGPKLVAQQDPMSHASVARKTQKFEVAFRKYLVLSLRQNNQLEAVKVPTSLRPTVKPVVKMMKKADAHLFKALVSSRHGDLNAARSQLKTLTRVAGQFPNARGRPTHLDRDDLVRADAVLAREPRKPAAEGVAHHAHVR
jgi:hypothetical protein